MRRQSTGLALLFLLAGGAQAGPGALADALQAAPGTPEFALRDGDRVVFYGDSITQDGGYARLVEEYAVTRFPTWDLRFYNAGVGGDTVKGGWAGDIETRLERDVVALRPTVVTIMLGMNDGGYKPYDPQTFSAYAEGYRAIVSRLRDKVPGARLTLIRPSPFDDVTRPPGFAPGYDDVLRRYGCYVTALGAREKTEVVDFREPLNAGLAAVEAENPALARQLLPDRVHPSEAGHLVLGAALLRAWGAPTQVTRVVIDAASATVVAAEGAAVSGLERAGGGLRWTQTDEALPLPLNFEDADVALAERAGAGLAALDRQPLLVTGLPAGDWVLRIEGAAIGTFSAEALAAGVDLAAHGTPMRWQAYEARWGASDRHEVQRVRRRLLATAGDSRPMKEAAEALATLDEQTQRARKDAVRPQPRTYEVVPAAN
jgi:lysophospholipase L1-like esterase